MPARARTGFGFGEELSSRLHGRSLGDRKLLLVGVLNRHLPADAPAILVGRALVKFYTSGGFAAGDVDLIGDERALGRLLSSAGFEGNGALWSHPGLGLVVEIAGPSLRTGERTVTLEYEGYRFLALSLEDALVDCLQSWKFWRSLRDWEQGVVLWVAHRDRMDRARLVRRAAAADVGDTLQELQRLVATREVGLLGGEPSSKATVARVAARAP